MSNHPVSILRKCTVRGAGMPYIFILVSCIGACTSIPDGVQPVTNLDLNRYLGRWYEIARLDHSFERGLTDVTADYSMLPDGGVKVVNRGFNIKDKKWEQVEGKAYFVDREKYGHLKVSFFGPFYGSYIIFELDQKDYQYALVSGPNRSYLWVQSRRPKLQSSVKEKLFAKAKQLGFDTSQLITVSHN